MRECKNDKEMKDIAQNDDLLDQNSQEVEQKADTIYDRLVDYGMLQYTPGQIAKCEGMAIIDVRILLLKDEKAKTIYDKAYANAQFELDSKVLSLAMSGDVKAIAMHQDRLARAAMEDDD